jgi:signal transduction histidine kinase
LILAALMLACFGIAVLLGWSKLASRLDGEAYDWMFTENRLPAWKPKAILLAINEASLIEMGGARNLRVRLAEALDSVCAAKPLAVAVDLMLSSGDEPKVDEALAKSFRACPSVILGADIVRDAKTWEEPIAPFQKVSAATGHVHADPDPVSRRIPLEKAVNGKRYWALALEAFRLAHQAGPVLESPEDLEIGMLPIPAPRATARSLYVRYASSPIPQVSLADLKRDPSAALLFSGKVVFVGFTDQSAARDRLMTPMGFQMTGVEIHANLFETLEQQAFLRDSGPSMPVLLAFLAAAGAGVIFALLSGWTAWVSAAAFALIVCASPVWFFRSGIVVGPVMVWAAAMLSTSVAASFHYFVLRRQWRKSEADKTRYQQAIHFVTHEMKTPLTAIQGSSEIMSRYKLNEDKQKQIAQMIHSESKRLASMIQTFLDVERLSEGEMELKQDTFTLSAVLLPALERARQLAERKDMAMNVGAMPAVSLRGDRELLEYAFYNLLNNAVKYSPEGTSVECRCTADSSRLHIAIEDHGMGMDPADLKRVFDRFFRSRRAEESGIAGTGIGLSIVNEIVAQHEGRIEVASELGKGSTFTVVLPFVPMASLDSEVGNANQRSTSAR